MEHQIEPELRSGPPRRARRRGARGMGTVFSQYFLIPVVALALAMPLWTVHMALVRAFGPRVQGSIVERYREPDRETGDWRHYLRYRAAIGGKEVIQRELVDRESFLAAPIGTTVPLKLSPLLPGFDSVLLVPGRQVWGIVWGLGFASLIMVAGGGALVWFIYVLPARRRRLVISGVAVVGRVVDKTKAVSTKSQSYALHYEYLPVHGASPMASLPNNVNETDAQLRGRQDVRADEWEVAQVGDKVTVLYDESVPRFSVLYRYADFEVG